MRSATCIAAGATVEDVRTLGDSLTLSDDRRLSCLDDLGVRSAVYVAADFVYQAGFAVQQQVQ